MTDNGLCGYVIAGRYTIQQPLETHDISALYGGQDGETRAYVLLKHSGDTSLAARQEFERECRQRVNTRHTAHRLDWCWIDRPDPRAGGWEIFEWNEGVTLAGWLAEQNGPIAPRRAIEIILPICQAMTDWYEAELRQGRGSNQNRLIYNSITLDSIGLRPDQQGHLQAFLRDYSISYAESRHQFTATPTWPPGPINGPGQFNRMDRRDAPTDVYALGEILYQLVTHRRPANIDQRRRYHAQLERADAVNPAVSSRLADAIEQAMALDAGQRFASPAALGAALEEAIRSPAQPNTGTSTGGDEWWLGLLFLAAIVAVIVMVVNSMDSPPAAQPTPADIGAGGVQPTAVPPTPLPPTATPDVVATLTTADKTYVRLIGPLEGVLPATTDRPADALISESLADFALEAVFINPDSPTWDYGFAFRHDNFHHFRLSVAADGTWALIYCNEAESQPLCVDPELVGDGVANGLILGAGQENRLRLLVANDYGVAFVNKQQVALFNLPVPTGSSALFVAAGLRANSNPTPVTYRDLIVRAPQ